MSRHSEYTPEVIDKAQAYLLDCKDGYDLTTKSLRVNLPSIAGLAIFLSVARKTIYNWAESNPDFLHILELILAEQEKRLIDNGLAGTYNATIAKLALGKHGYAEEQNLNHEVGENLADLMREVNEPKRKIKAKVQK